MRNLISLEFDKSKDEVRHGALHILILLADRFRPTSPRFPWLSINTSPHLQKALPIISMFTIHEPAPTSLIHVLDRPIGRFVGVEDG